MSRPGWRSACELGTQSWRSSTSSSTKTTGAWPRSNLANWRCSTGFGEWLDMELAEGQEALLGYAMEVISDKRV